jgi:U3 small nucleolar RNA-associated protein 6
MQNIEYARKQKAYKKLSQILTNVLRLHPMKSELWIYAAQFAMDENGDMTEARSYMQRGLRFCKNSRNMWLEYARLELVYIAKITARRKILGVGEAESTLEKQKAGDDMDADFLQLPTLTAEDIDPNPLDRSHLDKDALRKLEPSPAMSGAIPRAIFDAAMSHFKNDLALGASFFDMVCEFDQIACRLQLLEHIDGSIITAASKSWKVQFCHIRLPVVGILTSSPEFPGAIATSLSRLKDGLSQASEKKSLASAIKTWILHLLEDHSLDPALQKVLRSKVVSMDKVQ